MGGKKKAGKGKDKKKKDEEPDESTEKLHRLYRRKCNEEGIPILKRVDEKFSQVREDDAHFRDFYVWEEVGANGLTPFFNAVKEINFIHLRAIRLWGTMCGDAGATIVGEYLQGNTTVKVLELTDCGVSSKGCEPIAKVFDVEFSTTLVELKLDFNRIGGEGLALLGDGICRNATLAELSFAHCEIDATGARPLIEMLTPRFSLIKKVNLEGNLLGNEGITELLPMLKLNKTLESINLSDNKFGEDPELLNELSKLMSVNKTLKHYNIDRNGIYETGTAQIVEAIKEGGAVTKMDINGKISGDLLKDFTAALKGNKPKKGKKKGKKGKKKKKK